VFDDLFLAIADSGIARVWTNVIGAIACRGLLDDADVELVVLNRSDRLLDSGARCIDFPEYDFVNTAEDRKLVTMACRDLEADLFLSSYYSFALGIPSVMMVYDLIPERYGFDGHSRGWLERKLAIAHARRYVAISASTKRDLVDCYPHVQPSVVSVAHPGVDADVFIRRTSHEVAEFKASHDLRDFLVMVGSRYQMAGYKNGDLVMTMLSEGAVGELDVVLVGGEPLQEHERAVCASAGVRVVRLALDDEQLAICLSAASVLLYPSLYEGFGLPPLEALACGTPVVCTATSSLPEAVGPLGLTISGHDPVELRSQVERALTPSWRRLVAAQGPQWASRFTWGDMAQTIVDTCLTTLKDPASQAGPVDSFLAAYTDTVLPMQR
jgi:glycosyltransferase involved in cell wall biosynthesis